MTSGITKPTKWLYSDEQLAPESGVSYELRYIGSMPVRVSIKAVDLETRTRIAHASIHQVCEDVGRKLPRTTRPNKTLEVYLGAESDKNWAMTNVYLTITSQALTVETIDLNWRIFRHNLSMVSFASGGDAETLDFVCYVAKNDEGQRMCYVFEGIGGLAQDVIMTLGQAFRLGYQDFKKGKTHPVSGLTDADSHGSTLVSVTRQHLNANSATTPTTCQTTSRLPLGSIETPFVLPPSGPDSKTNGYDRSMERSQPPDSIPTNSLTSPPVLPPPNHHATTFDHFANFDENAWLLENDASNADALDSSVPCNNHDRNRQARTHPVFSACTMTSGPALPITTCSAAPSVRNTGINTNTVSATINTPSNLTARTEMATNHAGSEAPFVSSTGTTASAFERLEPVGEPWYVGKMSRTQAESLLRYEGDFLVRASPHQSGQFVLSGMQDSKCRHLLLADPNGLVRTKERVFDSIQHLIDYHVQNGVPIRSADSEIRLIFPVSTFTFCES
ncbi:Src 2 domain-containing transforming protein C1 [Fasciola gigantica]|uniref:Src 2 domain-containing transforming protein C1 n=1 Tax=Fasciola gigantica TaxID=46835 RepID=A0A504Y7C0_FASGI|nr:Src 2 domain-containing transforming protein C1 [Fasciola gigantica]